MKQKQKDKKKKTTMKWEAPSLHSSSAPGIFSSLRGLPAAPAVLRPAAPAEEGGGRTEGEGTRRTRDEDEG